MPWDHIDTGIDKQWLKADLHKALEAAIVPDCSFEGCSHCGVCGADFGHNVVVQPLPIPQFEGHFKPNQEKVQRLRVWFGKQGDMALVSHLDLVRLFDRAVRRAALPIAFTGGFHPSPRISIANALSLGATSTGELVDFELTKTVDLVDFQERLAAALPADVPIYRVEAIAPTTASATKLLEQAKYYVAIRALIDGTSDSEPPSPVQWQNWIEAIKAADVIGLEQKTKSGKTKQVNLCDRLFDLSLVKDAVSSGLPPAILHHQAQSDAILQYVGSCRNDGSLLRPEHVVYMLEQIAQRPFQLLHTHRSQLLLSPAVTE